MGKMKCPPLLVGIQSIDIASLNFQSGSATTVSKSRNVACLEATNLFLFVGCTSGTIYVFSRDTLKFIFMIPFKGGKACHISSTLDESDIAVASIRGKVSIYRISPNVHFMHSQSQQQSRSSSSSPGEAFRHLYDVPHHVQNEITEMQWSPNGKYLFIGDSQGLISQVDVASLEEFPRPPPSRIILKLQSRILQIDCSFPFMAVCTLNASYLCDLEKEDFTRIKTIDKKKDVKSAGLCFAFLPSSGEDLLESNNSPSSPSTSPTTKTGKMVLLLGELGTGHIYQCTMDGTVSSYKPVKLDAMVHNSVKLFDPKVPVDIQLLSKTASLEDLNFSPGKMLSTDDGLIVSVSSDRIFVYDPSTTDIILFNEDFNRIKSFKIIANYGFIWHGNKFDVIAFTNFRSYGKQLSRAGLNSVLENWITYAIYSVGWREEYSTHEDEELEIISEMPSLISQSESAISVFRQMMFPVDEDDDFCNFVSSHLPFALVEPKIEPKVEESEATKCHKAINKLFSDLKHITDFDGNPILLIWKYFETFYTDLGVTLPQLDFKHSEITLTKVLVSIQIFLKQPQLTNLIKEQVQSTDFEEEIVKVIINCFQSKDSLPSITLFNNTSNQYCFTKYSDCPVVRHYFNEIGVKSTVLFYDALLADTIILLAPLLFPTPDLLVTLLKESLNLDSQIINLFFTWMVLITNFNNQDKTFPYGSLIRNLQNEQFFDKLAEDILSCVYRDSILPRDEDLIHVKHQKQPPSKFLHHFITFVVLFSKSPNVKTRGVNLLISLFPLTRGVKKDIIDKIVQICALNPYLIKLYYKACMEDGKSMKLCDCGIQACYGSLENTIPAYQKAIEEAILISLTNAFLDSEVTTKMTSKELLASPVHQFAMRRCLIEAYLESSVSDEILSDWEKIRVILRSGVCSGLASLKFNLENLKVLRETVKRNHNFLETNCSHCGLLIQGVIQPKISMDCVGVWILENVHSIDKFMKIVKKMNLNSPAEFSLRFYRFLLKRDHLKRNHKEDAGFGDLISLSDLTCSVLH